MVLPVEVPQEDLPENSAAPADPGQVPDHDLPDQPATEVPQEDLPTDYGSLGEMAKTAVEGFRKGVLGPIASLEDKYLPDTNGPEEAQEEQNRAAANPWTHGLSEAAGLITGPVGAGAGIAGDAVSGAAANAANIGKVGSTAIKGAIEGGLFQTSDEISKAILGQGDPEAPVSSAIAHIGAAALLGGGIGGASAGLAKIGETKLGTSATQFLQDMGNRLQFNQDNPDLVSAVTNELKDFFGSTSAAADDVYGPTGLKAQAIEKLVPEMNDAISSQNQEIADTLQNKISEMVQDPESYPTRLTKKLQNDVNQWMEVTTNPEANSNQIFNATQDLKQRLQAYSKFDKAVGPLSPEKDFINVAKNLQHGLIQNLEDTSVWGKAGELQKGVNKAFTDFLPAQKDFLSKFTTKVQDEAQIDPGKVNTYVNQLGNPRAEIKQGMLNSYVDAAEKYRSQIDDLHGRLGVETPLSPASLNATKGTFGQVTNGAKFADKIFHLGIDNFAQRTAQSTLGGLEGYREHGWKGAVAGVALGAIAPHLEEMAGRKIRQYAVPAAIRVLTSGAPRAMGEALSHAEAVTKGALKIDGGISNLFKAGGQQAVDAYGSEKDREKLRKFIDDGELNRQIQQQANQPAQVPQQSQPQMFAEGGEVKSNPVSTAPAKPVLQGSGGLSEAMPEQAMLMSAAKGRINNYLNSIRPLPNQAKLPFDEDMPDKEKERSYNRALDLANQPLSILNEIKAGTITPEHVQHFSAMYPELHNHLAKKMTEKISKAQVNDEKPTYKVRQGMSLFLGAPMDSTLTPEAIQAAQGVFAQQQAKQQPANAPVTKSKKNTSKLGQVAKDFQTTTQAAEARQRES